MLAEIGDDKERRPALYKHKWLGEPENMGETRIYTGWETIEALPDTARLERRYLDFGYSVDESAIGDIFYNNGNYAIDEQLYQKGMSNKQLADFLLNLPNPKTLVIADSAEPKSIDELRSFGVNVLPCEKGKDSVNFGIQLVQDQKIKVLRSSFNLLKEYRNYLWLVDKNGEVKRIEDPKCANHHMAGIRYAMTSIVPIKRRREFINSLPNIPPTERVNIAL